MPIFIVDGKWITHVVSICRLDHGTQKLGEILKRTTGIGVLVGAALLGTIASGTAIAAPQDGTANERVRTNATIPDGFFKPGVNTVVKRNHPQQSPANLAARLKASDDVEISGPKEICGTTKVEKTSGKGKTTLVMTVEKSVKTGLTGEIGISHEELSAKLGFSVERSFTIKDESRFEVPKGKMGFIEAYPTFDMYTVTQGDMTGWVMKPVGVCFNQWTS